MLWNMSHGLWEWFPDVHSLGVISRLMRVIFFWRAPPFPGSVWSRISERFLGSDSIHQDGVSASPLKETCLVEVENAVHLTVVAPCLNINVPEAAFNIKDHGISPKQTSKLLSDWVSSILSCPAPRQNTQDASVGISRKQQIRVEISSPDPQCQ